MAASSAHRVQLPYKSDSSNRTATPLAMKTGRELIHKSPEYHHATGDSQNDRATPRPLYMGAKSRTGRGDGPSAVFSTSSLSVTKYENPQKRFLTSFCARAAATAAASGTSFASTCACAPGFAFSVRRAYELPFDGEWSDDQLVLEIAAGLDDASVELVRPHDEHTLVALEEAEGGVSSTRAACRRSSRVARTLKASHFSLSAPPRR